MDVALWRYEWNGLDWMDLRVGGGIEHPTVPINASSVTLLERRY